MFEYCFYTCYGTPSLITFVCPWIVKILDLLWTNIMMSLLRVQILYGGVKHCVICCDQWTVPQWYSAMREHTCEVLYAFMSCEKSSHGVFKLSICFSFVYMYLWGSNMPLCCKSHSWTDSRCSLYVVQF